MSRTVTVRARMAPGLKAEVEALLEQLGVTTTDAINMFFSQIRLRKGCPLHTNIAGQMISDQTRQFHPKSDKPATQPLLNLRKSAKSADKITGATFGCPQISQISAD
jgi:DNA-damage-inducible protein J